jgi:hypothetical protein
MLHFEEAINTKRQLAATIIFQYATWNLSGCCFQELVLVPASARTEYKSALHTSMLLCKPSTTITQSQKLLYTVQA